MSSPDLIPRDRAALDAFSQRVRDALGTNLAALKLFGSKATGRASPDSDIDVLVLVNNANVETEDRVIDLAFEVNLAHDVYISPRVIAGATLEDPVWRRSPFVQTLLREARLL